MGLTAINPARYGRLLAKTLPRVIQTDEEFDRMVALLEELDFAAERSTPEQEALTELLTKLIEDYDDRRHPLPRLAPHKLLRHLMELRNLRQRDLIRLLGASSVVSDVVNGKRSISKAQAKKLAAFFRVPVELFI
ncbi:MAG: helix-turn-helix domain-containing protein [Acidobacteria bacterium]|nr:helix-turn-helix domain-containing protein [Acidobacteriota bacterium]